MQLLSTTTAETITYGQQLGALLAPGDVICLSGELGAGKTTFARGIGQGWQSTSRLTSPTYTLIHNHQRTIDHQILYHVDGYRLENPNDIYSVGLDDVFDDDGAVLIEWPERLLPLLPDDRLWIRLEPATEQRIITFEAQGSRALALLNRFSQQQG